MFNTAKIISAGNIKANYCHVLNFNFGVYVLLWGFVFSYEKCRLVETVIKFLLNKAFLRDASLQEKEKDF